MNVVRILVLWALFTYVIAPLVSVALPALLWLLASSAAAP